jgi:hypothetical protein
MQSTKPYAKNSISIPKLEKSKRTDTITIRVTDYLPHQKHAASKKYLKHYKLIESILKHFSTGGGMDTQNIGKPLDISFFQENALGPNVSDNLITEAWRFFLEYHSVWQFGPRGYYLADGRDACEGCSDKFCHFAQEFHCLAIGKWLANTLLRSTNNVIPLPIDPLFIEIITRTIHLFESFTEEEANDEYSRLLENREKKLLKITEGFFAAKELGDTAKDIPLPLLISHLFRPHPVDREELMGCIEMVLSGKNRKQNEKLQGWFLTWLCECDEIQLRWFLFEVLGTPYPRPNNKNRFVINIGEEKDSTSADICQNILTLPSVKDEALFKTILDFRGPFLFNK